MAKCLRSSIYQCLLHHTKNISSPTHRSKRLSPPLYLRTSFTLILLPLQDIVYPSHADVDLFRSTVLTILEHSTVQRTPSIIVEY